ncbi:hypothetical protein PR048_012097 [Dryococelus australis]|uniref:Uncharacterized protein n=1 Tax=Dryococelus australis TaxID=614101 RepID=A0ABQ9HP67_9NEOP|nr:hypothetical protein PR048_012097 [Dryococelus australis]
MTPNDSKITPNDSKISPNDCKTIHNECPTRNSLRPRISPTGNVSIPSWDWSAATMWQFVEWLVDVRSAIYFFSSDGYITSSINFHLCISIIYRWYSTIEFFSCYAYEIFNVAIDIFGCAIGNPSGNRQRPPHFEYAKISHSHPPCGKMECQSSTLLRLHPLPLIPRTPAARATKMAPLASKMSECRSPIGNLSPQAVANQAQSPLPDPCTTNKRVGTNTSNEPSPPPGQGLPGHASSEKKVGHGDFSFGNRRGVGILNKARRRSIKVASAGVLQPYLFLLTPEKCGGNGRSLCENPPTSGIVRNDSHLRKSAVNWTGIEPGSPLWEESKRTRGISDSEPERRPGSVTQESGGDNCDHCGADCDCSANCVCGAYCDYMLIAVMIAVPIVIVVLSVMLIVIVVLIVIAELSVAPIAVFSAVLSTVFVCVWVAGSHYTSSLVNVQHELCTEQCNTTTGHHHVYPTGSRLVKRTLRMDCPLKLTGIFKHRRQLDQMRHWRQPVSDDARRDSMIIEGRTITWVFSESSHTANMNCGYEGLHFDLDDYGAATCNIANWLSQQRCQGPLQASLRTLCPGGYAAKPAHLAYLRYQCFFFKYVFAIPIKNKKAKNVANALECVLLKIKLLNIQSGAGLEFYNKTYKELIINHYSTFGELKASVVERYNHTM